MVLSLSASFEEKIKRGASSPVYLVELQLSIPSGSSYTKEAFNIKFCSGDRPLRQTTRDTDKDKRAQYIIPNMVLEVGEISQEVDAIARSCSIANTNITFVDDGTLRDILATPSGTYDPAAIPAGNLSRHLYGQKVTLSLAFQDLDISESLQLGTFVIEEVLPQKNIIELQCRTISSILASFKVHRNYRARDPYAQLDQILRHTCALVDAQYDRTTVDPYWNGVPANDMDRRHLSLRRATEVIDVDFLSTSKAPDGEGAWKLAQGICYVTGGFVTENAAGAIVYVPWDPNKASDRDLTEDDITDFAQEIMYANTVNSSTHTITADKLGITYDPYGGNLSSGSHGAWAGPSQQAAYFGGNNSATTLTQENETSATAFAFFDSSAVPNAAYKDKRWLELSSDIEWESGMAYCTFLRAPTIAWSSMLPSDHATTGSGRLGAASYDHATKKITLASGKLNTTDVSGIPTGTGNFSAVEPDYIYDGGLVFRVVDDAAEAVAENCVYKEGRITEIDNTGATSVLTIADDQVLEYTGDWGKDLPVVVGGYHWEILDPEYPVSAYGGQIGNRMRGANSYWDAQLNPIRSYNDLQRYFYIQYAAHTGFAGANYGAAGSETVSSTTNDTVYQVGPGAAENQPTPYPTNLKLAYGHDDTGTAFAQLRGLEWTTNNYPTPPYSYDPRYAYIKLESNARRFDGTNRARQYHSGSAAEIIKCNLAYPTSGIRTGVHIGPLPAGWRRPQDIHRREVPAPEGPSAYTGDVNPGGRINSCCAYRVEAESFTTMDTWEAPSGRVIVGGGIHPSGRGSLGSSIPRSDASSSYNVALIGSYFSPQAISQPIPVSAPSAIPPVYFWTGVKATDVTSANFINERILNRCSYGMPVVKVSTSLRHIDLELGDFVSIVSDVYLQQGQNGTAGSAYFEIVRKEVFLEEDSPHIEFMLAWVREGSTQPTQPTTSVVHSGRRLDGYTASWFGGTQLIITNTGTIILDSSGNSVIAGIGLPGT